MDTRPLAVTFSAAADGRSVTIDRACHLVAYSYAPSGAALISWDQSATVANTITAPASAQLSSVIAVMNAGTGGSQLAAQLNIPLSAGEVIYVSRSTAGIVVMYFVDDAT